MLYHSWFSTLHKICHWDGSGKPAEFEIKLNGTRQLLVYGDDINKSGCA
jgi:hypothetical protein